MKKNVDISGLPEYTCFVSYANNILNNWLISKYGDGVYVILKVTKDFTEAKNNNCLYKDDILYCRLSESNMVEVVSVGREY